VPKNYPLPGPVARSLEVVGDRWTLLVVRELLLGGRRWAELERALPGIPSNLLAATAASPPRPWPPMPAAAAGS
jgi:DNA-binding HxlR family transcriptional regulator